MPPSSHPLDRLAVTFDDPHAVANAGLLPASLAQHLGLRVPIEAEPRRSVPAPGLPREPGWTLASIVHADR